MPREPSAKIAIEVGSGTEGGEDGDRVATRKPKLLNSPLEGLKSRYDDDKP